MIIKKIIKEIKQGWRKDEWWRFRLPSLIVRAIFCLFRRTNNGIYITKEDWDNLIILDACTYEIFAATNWIKGKLEKKISRGSHTRMFMKENFKDYYPDTIYVSGNPFIWEFRKSFYRSVYISSVAEIKKYGTLLPETILKQALKINKEYPDKRLIIHFLQPHDPFIGRTQIAEAKKQNISPFYLFAKGRIKESTLKKAYQDNLKRVLPAVEKLLKEFKGKTVITSDHGEAFGARLPFFPVRIYGHSGPRIKELVEIPWLMINKTPRKKIISAGEKEPSITIDEDEIKKHLQTLGYI